MKKPPLDGSVRADLFRAAQAYCDLAHAATAGVLIEPLPRGRGVLLIAFDGWDLVAIPDPTGAISRRVTIKSLGAMTKMAVDLFRRDGAAVRLVFRDDLARIEPDVSNANAAAGDIELGVTPLDWRGELARHAHKSMEPPYVGDARSTRRLADTASVLARAAGLDIGVYELKGGVDGAVLATFPAWPDAVALYQPRPHLIEARERCVATTWSPADWLTRPGPGLVHGSLA